MEQTSQRKWVNWLKRRWLPILLALLLLAGLAFVFFPRSLDGLILMDQDDVAAVELIEYFPDGSGAVNRHELTGEAYDRFLSLLEGAGARLQVPPLKSANGGDFTPVEILVTYRSAENNEKMHTVSFFTKTVLTVDGVQYRLYGDGLYEKISALPAW